SARRGHELPGWYWLLLPVLLYLVHYLFRALLSYETYRTWFTSELGFTEEGTTALAVAAAVMMALAARGLLRRSRTRLAAWYMLLTLGCLYLAGEEASWGQHWFGWGTPDVWEAANVQSETNLHNLDGWERTLFDQLPRLLLSLMALIAGGIMPLVRRARGKLLPLDATSYWLLPTFVCVPVSLLTALGSVPQHVLEHFYDPLPPLLHIHAGQVKDLLLAYFLLTYALSTWRRLCQR